MLSTYKKIEQIIPSFRKGMTDAAISSFLYELLRLTPIILVKILLDVLILPESDGSKIMGLMAGVLGAYLGMNVIDHYAKKAQYKRMLEYETCFLKQAKKKLLELHIGYHETINTGAQVSKITKGAHKLMELLWFTFEEFIPTVIQLLITMVLLFYEQWMLGLLFVISVPLTIGIIAYAARKVQPYRKKYHKKYDEAVGELGESLFNISTVKDYAQEQRQFRIFNGLLAEYKALAWQRWQVSLSTLIWRDLFIALGRASLLGAAVYMVVKEILSPGSLVLVYTLGERAFVSTHRIGRLYNYLEDAVESIDRLLSLLKEKPLVKNREHAEPVKSLKGDIEFRTVAFGYGSHKLVLPHLQLRIKPKQAVALVGKSGSGKTTIAKLLLRNYDVTGGQILVDGKDIRDYIIESYKKRIAVVSQNVEIFNRTVLENILFANPAATRSQVIEAAKRAYAHDFIMEFPKGYETLVGEKGIRLSGGQKQRISIARALLKDPDIFIFDEATSSLDSESEQFIQKSIFSVAGKKTTIIIAHRLSTIQHVDRVFVIDKGEVVEEGSYKGLLEKKGHFAKMVEMQEMVGLRE